jgi:hypothetical protein
MDLCSWVDERWRKPNEPFTAAIARLHDESGLAYKTLFYAYRGCRVSPATATRIEALTRGAVSAVELIFLPPRAERRLRRRRLDSSAKRASRGAE